MTLLQKRIITLFLIIIGIFSIWYFHLTKYISLEWIKTNRDYLLVMVKQHYWYSVLTYIAFYILATTFALPGTFIITMTGGFLFGLFPGVIYINAGATLGAAGAFLASRYLIGTWVQQKYHQHLTTINHEIEQYGSYYFLIVRLVLVFPFFVVNLLAGLTNVSLATFMWTTSLGIIPATLVYAYTGQQLVHIRSTKDLLSWPMILAFVLLSLLFLLPLLLHKKNK